jgi:nicotinate-nucleotide adenylyltransferase
MQSLGTNKIGILGGTFNPIHLGHLILAQCACETYDLDKVLFIPCGIPPHKNPVGLISAEHRMAMVSAAVEGDLRFEASDVEIKRSGISYAVDTVGQLREMHPEADLHFIIGSDTLPELHQWKNVYSLLRLCQFVVFVRPGLDPASLKPEALRLDPPWAERMLERLTVGRQIDISASDIRYRIAEGMSIRYLVTPEVEMYIATHGLYR